MSHNVGMLFMREVHSTEGRMCKDCLGRTYLRHQSRNIVFGWWGFISFVMTWYFLLANTATFIACRWRLIGDSRRLAGHRSESGDTPERRLAGFDQTVIRRLASGDDPDDIASDLAEVTGVSSKRARAFVDEHAG